MCVPAGKCSSSSPAHRTVKAVTRARDVTSTLAGTAAIDIARAQTVAQARTSGRTGPLFNVYATTWPEEEAAAVWTLVRLICSPEPFEFKPPNMGRRKEGEEEWGGGLHVWLNFRKRFLEGRGDCQCCGVLYRAVRCCAVL